MTWRAGLNILCVGLSAICLLVAFLGRAGEPNLLMLAGVLALLAIAVK